MGSWGKVRQTPLISLTIAKMNANWPPELIENIVLDENKVSQSCVLAATEDDEKRERWLLLWCHEPFPLSIVTMT